MSPSLSDNAREENKELSCGLPERDRPSASAPQQLMIKERQIPDKTTVKQSLVFVRVCVCDRHRTSEKKPSSGHREALGDTCAPT